MSTAAFKKPPHGPQSRQKRSKTTIFCLPPTPKSPRADLKVDKNEAKRPHFVYRCLQKSPHGTRSRTN
ncbi:hypothetical protein HMPREF0542_10040, partial [Ligilactobacillus ruminis ATCC 25644]